MMSLRSLPLLFKCLRKGIRLPVISLFHDYEREFGHGEAEKSAQRGFEAILVVESGLSIRSTWNVVGRIAEKYPRTITDLIEAKHDLGLHSYEHEMVRDTSRIKLEENIRKSIELFDRFGVRIKGYRSPRSLWSNDLIHVLQDFGFHWSAETENKVEPYFIKSTRSAISANGTLLRIPVFGDDWTLHSKKTRSANELFGKYLSIMKRHPNRVYVLGTHEWVIGSDPRHIAAYKSFVETLRENHFSMRTFSELYEMYRDASLNLHTDAQ